MTTHACCDCGATDRPGSFVPDWESGGHAFLCWTCEPPLEHHRSTHVDLRIIEKPWGSETIWAKTDRYVGKILHVRAGEALSLQYHQVKDETIMLLSGRATLFYALPGDGDAPPVGTTITLARRDPFRIPPGMHHRLTAIEDSEVLEVSTPELDDVVRLEDRYGRVAK